LIYRLSHPRAQPAGDRALALRGTEPDVLTFLDKRNGDLFLVDSSDSHQAAHVEGTDVELVVATAFPRQRKPLKLSAQRSYSICSGSLQLSPRQGQTTF
jgi:hypothetical protein